MQVWHHHGARDTDVVLSVVEITRCSECLSGQCSLATEKLVVPELRYKSACLDMRVGERASKRRRAAGTVEQSIFPVPTQRHIRANRKRQGKRQSARDKLQAAGPLPKGWKVIHRVVGDGRRCECPSKLSESGSEVCVHVLHLLFHFLEERFLYISSRYYEDKLLCV